MKETIKYFSVIENESPINVLMTGVSICDKNHRYVRNKPSVTIIEYVFKGEGTLLINNKRISVKEGDIYILPAGINHEYYACPNNPWAKYFMNFSGSLAQSLITFKSVRFLASIQHSLATSSDKITTSPSSPLIIELL